MRRYLAAFGPATVADVQRWSGLRGLGEVVDRLRRELVGLTGPDGRALVDLPDAPRPDPDTPAPPRFLYDFDNLLLSHADRSRVVTEDFRRATARPHGPVAQAVLVDGVTAGEWALARDGDRATLTVTLVRAPADPDAVAAEGAALLAFLAAGAGDRRVVLAEARP